MCPRESAAAMQHGRSQRNSTEWSVPFSSGLRASAPASVNRVRQRHKGTRNVPCRVSIGRDDSYPCPSCHREANRKVGAAGLYGARLRAQDWARRCDAIRGTRWRDCEVAVGGLTRRSCRTPRRLPPPGSYGPGVRAVRVVSACTSSCVMLLPTQEIWTGRLMAA